LRDWALADDQIAGTDSMPAPASAAVDFRNSRRLMKASRMQAIDPGEDIRKGLASAITHRGAVTTY
jgi:hypothetical protein